MLRTPGPAILILLAKTSTGLQYGRHCPIREMWWEGEKGRFLLDLVVSKRPNIRNFVCSLGGAGKSNPEHTHLYMTD